MNPYEHQTVDGLIEMMLDAHTRMEEAQNTILGVKNELKHRQWKADQVAKTLERLKEKYAQMEEQGK